MTAHAVSFPASAAASHATERWRAWDAHVAATPAAGFMQTSWWADFRTTAGYEHAATIIRDRGAVAGGAVVLKFEYTQGHCFYYVPDGPVVPNGESAGDVFAAVRDAIESEAAADPRVVSHVRIEPRWERLPDYITGFTRRPPFADTYVEPRDTLCVDLRPDEAAILAQMKPKGRYSIGLARRHGVTIVEDRSEHAVDDFLAIYGDTANRQEFAAKPRDYFEDLVSILRATGCGSVFFADYRGMRIAAAIVVFFGPRATYFFGGSLATHRRVMAPYVLHFEIMRHAKARGHDWYDFWGVAPVNAAPGHPWEAISTFKRKFGGVEVRLVPTLDLVLDASAYRTYVDRQAVRRGR